MDAVNPAENGTKACAWYQLDVGSGETEIVRIRLAEKSQPSTLVHDIDGLFARRIAEADEFYSFCPSTLSEDGKRVQRQAFAGLLWSKQYYHFVINDWLKGDPTQPVPPRERLTGRDSQWIHLFNEDVLSMPDTWEYPWYAAWDLSFHMISSGAGGSGTIAKSQPKLFLREWYMHPNGQIPGLHEWAFGDVNPSCVCVPAGGAFQIGDCKPFRASGLCVLRDRFS